MELTRDYVDRVIKEFFARGEPCRKYGIPLTDIVSGVATVPPGWEFDATMAYYMPPTLLES